MESLIMLQEGDYVSASIKAVQPYVKCYSAKFTDKGFVVSADG